MNVRKAIILVTAAVICVGALLCLSMGILMVADNAPGHRDFAEGLMLLIPSAIGLVLIPAVTWAVLKSNWIKSESDSHFCCPKCGYNMAGLSLAKCPECGAEFTLDQLKLK